MQRQVQGLQGQVQGVQRYKGARAQGCDSASMQGVEGQVQGV